MIELMEDGKPLFVKEEKYICVVIKIDNEFPFLFMCNTLSKQSRIVVSGSLHGEGSIFP